MAVVLACNPPAVISLVSYGSDHSAVCTKPVGASGCGYLGAPGCNGWTAQENSLFPPLSVEDAAEIGGAMITVWVIAWGIRRVIQFLGIN